MGTGIKKAALGIIIFLGMCIYLLFALRSLNINIPFVELRYEVKAKTIEENVSSFSGFGISQGERIVEARFALKHFNLAEENSSMAAVDAGIIESLKKRWELLK